MSSIINFSSTACNFSTIFPLCFSRPNPLSCLFFFSLPSGGKDLFRYEPNGNNGGIRKRDPPLVLLCVGVTHSRSRKRRRRRGGERPAIDPSSSTCGQEGRRRLSLASPSLPTAVPRDAAAAVVAFADRFFPSLSLSSQLFLALSSVGRAGGKTLSP